jgi:hypothetical protein
MNPGDLTPKETAWCARAHSAISSRRQATFDLLLDEPIGREARVYLLERLLLPRGRNERIHLKQPFVMALLNHPAFEWECRQGGEELLHGALTIPMLDVIPLLYDKGFLPIVSQPERDLIASHLIAGRWPHADTLAPDILSDTKTYTLARNMFSQSALLREEFVRCLVKLDDATDWENIVCTQFLEACNNDLLQDLIEHKMHRGQVVSSLAVLNTRGWLNQQTLEREITRRGTAASEGSLFAQELLGDAATHELQRSTPKMAVSRAVRRI